MKFNLSVDSENNQEIEELTRDIYKGLDCLNVCDVNYNAVENGIKEEGAKGNAFEIANLVLTTASAVALEEVIRYLITKVNRNKNEYSLNLNVGEKVVKITGEKDDITEILRTIMPNNE